MLPRKVFYPIRSSIILTNESKAIFENQTKLDKLNMRHREMIQELKDKEFQLECIQQLLTNSICNEVTTSKGRSILTQKSVIDLSLALSATKMPEIRRNC